MCAETGSVMPPETVSDTQRNGSIAGIAILLGFSLQFTATWTQGGDPWTVRSLVVFAIVIVGIASQLRALFTIISLPNISIDAHRLAAAWFLRGVIAVMVAYVLHISLDAVIDLGILKR